MTRIRPLLLSVFTAGAIALAGCSDDGGDEPNEPSGPASSDEIIKLLNCEKSSNPDPYKSFSIYDCEDPGDGGNVVYLMVYSGDDAKANSADEYANKLKTSREEKNEPRSLVVGDTWILDTKSQEAIDVAAENGGEIIYSPK